MFNNFKKKLNNIIQESFISLENRDAVNVCSRTTSTVASEDDELGRSDFSSTSGECMTGHGPTPDDDINMIAGCELLGKYEDDWKSIQSATDDNGRTASHIAEQSERIFQCLDVQRVGVHDMMSSLTEVPTVVEQLNACLRKMDEMRALSDAIQQQLDNLLDISEEYELHEFMQREQLQFLQVKQRRADDLEAYRQKLAKEHGEKLKRHEEHLKQVQCERQEVFDSVFREDLAEFKQSGRIARLQHQEVTTSNLTLEDIDLDDTDTKEALEEFLNE